MEAVCSKQRWRKIVREKTKKIEEVMSTSTNILCNSFKRPLYQSEPFRTCIVAGTEYLVFIIGFIIFNVTLTRSCFNIIRIIMKDHKWNYRSFYRITLATALHLSLKISLNSISLNATKSKEKFYQYNVVVVEELRFMNGFASIS